MFNDVQPGKFFMVSAVLALVSTSECARRGASWSGVEEHTASLTGCEQCDLDDCYFVGIWMFRIVSSQGLRDG